MSDEERERAYSAGNRMAYLDILQRCCMGLGYDSTEVKAFAASWIAERELAISALREVCDIHGDNDWPDDLHLSDIIEKHLGRYLDDQVVE